MMKRVRSGLPAGTVPLGYGIHSGKIMPQEPEASYVRQAFALIEQGVAVRAAMLRITQAGLLTKRGQPLSLSAFQNIIKNPIYAGFIRYEGMLHRGSHEPLVREDKFWRIQGRTVAGE